MNTVINIRCTEEEKAILKEYAKKAKIPLSEYIREKLIGTQLVTRKKAPTKKI